MRTAVLQQPTSHWPLEVLPDIACVQLPLVNLYLVGGDREWVMVDAGLGLFTERIVRAAHERFGPNSRPAAIVLTHGHFDHVGALPDLADRWDVPVYAHPLEMPYLTGRSSYPPPDPAVGGGAMSFLSRFYPRGPINLGNRVKPLPTDGSIPDMPGWRWVFTPGHSPGHVSLFREEDGTLLAGDAFVTVDQESALAVLFNQPPHVHRPPAYYTPDWQAARHSVEILSELHPQLAATGHGLSLQGEPLRQQLQDLLRNWDKVALPTRGRYIHQPALMGEEGVISIPKPVFDPNLLIVGAMGLTAVLGGLALSRSRMRR